MEIAEYSFEFCEENWIASTERTLFHPDSGSLILSDLHIGKAEHFRKNHFHIPGRVEAGEILRLYNIFNYYNPQNLYLLGDIFHSDLNPAWNNFSELIHSIPIGRKLLVKGNHDILNPELYTNAGLEITHRFEFNSRITLVHDANDCGDQHISISGHLHPGCFLQGKGKQSVILPCFYIGEKGLVLPAFGKLTGLKSLKRESEKDIYLAFTPSRFWKI